MDYRCAPIPTFPRKQGKELFSLASSNLPRKREVNLIRTNLRKQGKELLLVSLPCA